MKIAVLGAGLMGKEATRDLVNSAGVEKVTLADVDVKRAEAVCQQLQSTKLSSAYLDATNQDQLANFIRDYDVVINALFYTFNEKWLEQRLMWG